MNDADIRRIQTRLAELDLYKGAIDGDAGPKTNRALLDFALWSMFTQTAVKPMFEDDTWPDTFEDGTPAEPPSEGMKVSPAGRKAIAEREGTRLTAYKDSVGIWTVGVGHTSAAGPPNVTPGMKITASECDEILSRDLAKFEKAVLEVVKVHLAQHEFDALVSFAFNVGGGAFAKSTLLKKLNAGDRMGAADEFLKWTKAGGQTLKGLKTRRESEREQFLGF